MASSTDNKFSTARKGKDFTLYTHDHGPNGWKIAHAFEELGLDYESHFLNFQSGEHKGEGIPPRLQLRLTMKNTRKSIQTEGYQQLLTISVMISLFGNLAQFSSIS